MPPTRRPSAWRRRGILVGESHGGRYFFQPDQTVSRAEFLALAMDATGLEPMEDVTVTGFSDDEAIPTWAKGSISSALKAGVIQGERAPTGAPVFSAETDITCGEATVMLDRLLNMADVPWRPPGSPSRDTGPVRRPPIWPPPGCSPRTSPPPPPCPSP